MPSANEEYVFTSDGTLTIWNRDTGSLRDMGQFFTNGSTSPLVFFDIDVARDGTVYGLQGDSLYELDLRTNTATFRAIVGSSANALEITASGNFLVGYGFSDEIGIFRGSDYRLVRTVDTDGLGGGFGPNSAGDLQLIGNTVYLSGSNDELVGLNLFTGEQVFNLSDGLVSEIFGLTTQGNSLLFYAGTSVYRLFGDTFFEIENLDLRYSIYGAADAHFPSARFNTTSGADVVTGSFFSDTIYARGGRDTVYAGFGDDLVLSGDGADLVLGGDGYDLVYAGAGADTVIGAAGNDTLYGGGGADFILGGDENDLLGGAAGNDTLSGASGDDVLGGGNGNDVISGGSGDDLMFGFNGSDRLYGGADRDILYGGDDADTLNGGADWDLLFGGAGADLLIGGTGNDTMQGGFGPDTFAFSDRFGSDQITDFRGNDVIDLSDVVHAATSFAQLIDFYGFDTGFDAVISITSDRTIFLEDVNLSDLSASQFIL